MSMPPKIKQELRPHHVEELGKRAVTESFALKSGVSSKADNEVLALGFAASVPISERKNGMQGLLFTYWDLPRKAEVSCRLRPDHRFIIGDKPAKYISRKGDKLRAYYPSTTLPEHKTDPDIPVIITEGEFKALAIAENLPPCLSGPVSVIGLAGVNGGWQRDRVTVPLREGGNETRKEGPPRLIPDLDDWAWKGRVVYIVFDSDVGSRDNAKRFRNGSRNGAWGAEYTLVQLLRALGAKVWIVVLPPKLDGTGVTKNGIDDVIKRYGAERAVEIIMTCRVSSRDPNADEEFERREREAIQKESEPESEPSPPPEEDAKQQPEPEPEPKAKSDPESEKPPQPCPVCGSETCKDPSHVPPPPPPPHEEKANPFTPPPHWKLLNVASVKDWKCPPLEYVVEPFIARDNLVWVSADSQSGKTLLGLYTSLQLLREGKLFGKFPIKPVKKILYLGLEDPDRRFKERLLDMMRDEDLTPDLDRFHVYIAPGLAINDDLAWKWLEQFIHDGGYDLVYLDTFQKATPGISSFDDTKQSLVLHRTVDLVRRFRLVFIVHDHLAKNRDKKRNPEMSPDETKGTINKWGNSDCVIRLRIETSTPRQIAVRAWSKETDQEIGFLLDVAPKGDRSKPKFTYAGDLAAMGKTSKAKGERTRQKILDAMASGSWFSSGEIGKQVGCNDSTARRHLESLIEEKLVESKGERRLKRYRLYRACT